MGKSTDLRLWCAGAVVWSAAVLAATPEERAIAHLSEEVPSWVTENGCYSCHNNGDAVRALLRAKAVGFDVPSAALESSLKWLSQPANWDQTPGDPRFSDKDLARLQFSAAAAAATSGATPARQEIVHRLVAQQQSDGSWKVQGEEGVSSPVTWGTPLATAMAISILSTETDISTQAAVQRARRWLARRNISSTADAAAILLGLRDTAESQRVPREAALRWLTAAQGKSGGWGPKPGLAPEVFDTSLALLAVAEFAEAKPRIQRGRRWIMEAQFENGGWPETTRPPGGASYAQHVSTSAWALLALIETSTAQ